MKFKAFFIFIIITLLTEISAFLWYIKSDHIFLQDAVAINEAVQSVERDWDKLREHVNITSLDYTILDEDGRLLFATKPGLSESINAAVIHRDTILDINISGEITGKIIIYNDSMHQLQNNRKKSVTLIILTTVVQFSACAVYSVYLNRRVIKPFQKLSGFAERIAEGNLDIPLDMDRKNIFGAFTESFDIMRSELKKAKLSEARANAEKKELVAKLSHDIKTPVASIKAASELGAVIAVDEKNRQNYTQIIQKADQINTLVTNLFSATLEELQQLTVEPADINGVEISEMLENSDYFHYAHIPPVPDCMIYADKLRLQQVFDNIFANSYKYANTEITVDIFLKNKFLQIMIEDSGGGVPEKELPLLKDKYKRGQNSENVEGAGLGLYISDCFMTEMGGSLDVVNTSHGLAVTIKILLSGTI